MKHYVIIEIGSNSTKAIRGWKDGSRWFAEPSGMTHLRLMDGTRRISSAFTDELIELIAKLKAPFAQLDQVEYHMIATAGFRGAENAGEVCETVFKALGDRIRILSGREEAGLSYLAGTHDLKDVDHQYAVLDIGGASTELAFSPSDLISIPLAALQLTQQFIHHDPAEPREVAAAEACFLELLQELAGNISCNRLIGIGGTVTNLARLAFPSKEELHGTVLKRLDIAHYKELFGILSTREKQESLGIHPGRADIILAGAVILLSVLDHCRLDELRVSDRGVRYGYLYSLEQNEPDIDSR